ncbi:DUF2946 family protein [Biostraticola tofi]|uniref:DUF2946 family protein n=1 Tax=Biostraticola tofi TaxID=466109 RepID=UPI00104965B7
MLIYISNKYSWPAWLAVFSLLLLYIAPVISTSLVAHHTRAASLTYEGIYSQDRTESERATGNVGSAKPLLETDPAPHTFNKTVFYHTATATATATAGQRPPTGNTETSGFDASRVVYRGQAGTCAPEPASWHGGACEYCSLLLHLPLIFDHGETLIATHRISLRTAYYYSRWLFPRHIFPEPLPRAPPLISP